MGVGTRLPVGAGVCPLLIARATALVSASAPSRDSQVRLLEFLLAYLIVAVLICIGKAAPQETGQFDFGKPTVVIFVEPSKDTVSVRRRPASADTRTGPLLVAWAASSAPRARRLMLSVLLAVFFDHRPEFGLTDVAVIILVGPTYPVPNSVGHLVLGEFAVFVFVKTGHDRGHAWFASGRPVTPAVPSAGCRASVMVLSTTCAVSAFV